ncbi:MAG: DUF4367 domain-containing protein [Lachnospiraceae bacterium]|nr:DUF4367 domain-containing protein [Lachnospiraceae bacterium]
MKQVLMEEKIQNGIHDFFQEKLSGYLCACNEDSQEIDLSDDDIHMLSQQILALSDSARELFYGKYCFQMSEEAIEAMYGIELPFERLQYYKNILSSVYCRDDNVRIREEAFFLATKHAMEIDMAQTERDASKTSIIQTRRWMSRAVNMAVKGVAAAVIIMAIGFTAAITTNAEFREKVVEWLIETFQEFSSFKTVSEAEITMDDLRSYQITYVPARFTLSDLNESQELLSYAYLDEENNPLVIVLQIPGNELLVDTENQDTELVTFGGEDAFLIQDNSDMVTFACTIDGMPVFISGNVDREEVFSIAKGIRKK